MPLVRLNVFSDLPWEMMAPGLFDDFRNVQFYDYTKVPGRVVPDNYDITFSYAGTKRNVDSMDHEIRDLGRRVAVVFAASGLKRLYEVSYKVGQVRVTKRSDQKKKLDALALLHGTSTRKLGMTEVPKRVQYMRRKPEGKRPVAFSAKLPSTFIGLPVIDGDESDMRPYDTEPSVVGLRWKTPANQGTTLERAGVFVVLVDLVPSGGGHYHAIMSKTARFDATRSWHGLDYSEPS
jgi:hypothetical protein